MIATATATARTFEKIIYTKRFVLLVVTFIRKCLVLYSCIYLGKLREKEKAEDDNEQLGGSVCPHLPGVDLLHPQGHAVPVIWSVLTG